LYHSYQKNKNYLIYQRLSIVLIDEKFNLFIFQDFGNKSYKI